MELNKKIAKVLKSSHFGSGYNIWRVLSDSECQKLSALPEGTWQFWNNEHIEVQSVDCLRSPSWMESETFCVEKTQEGYYFLLGSGIHYAVYAFDLDGSLVDIQPDNKESETFWRCQNRREYAMSWHK